jgi:hypothetical protein
MGYFCFITSAQMLTVPNYQCHAVKGQFLMSAYAVYLIEIQNGNEKYYYVGQTGDPKALSARSPYYRLAALPSSGLIGVQSIVEKCLSVENNLE